MEKSLDFVDKPDIRGRTALHYTCSSADGDGEIIDALLSLGDAAVIADDDGWTPLHSAASSGNAVAVEKLVGQASAATLRRMFRGSARGVSSPVYLAARGGHAKLVATLVPDTDRQSLDARLEFVIFIFQF